jgi:hypothetical protein
MDCSRRWPRVKLGPPLSNLLRLPPVLIKLADPISGRL